MPIEALSDIKRAGASAFGGSVPVSSVPTYNSDGTLALKTYSNGDVCAYVWSGGKMISTNMTYANGHTLNQSIAYNAAGVWSGTNVTVT
jgi:hypothetical protein